MDQAGVFLRCTGKQDPREALEAVKSIGLRMVQVSKLPDRFYTPSGALEFKQLLESTGTRATAVVAVFDGESYRDLEAVRSTVGFRPAESVDVRVAYARKCVDFASAINVKIVTFHVGVLPQDPADPMYQRMLKATADIAEYARGKGVQISLETGQETAAELASFIDSIKVAPVRVNFDMANLVLYGRDDPPKALRVLLPRVTSVHVKDGNLPADSGKLGAEARLGEGKAGVAACLRILQEAGFQGPLIIENYMARTGTEPLAELRTAKEFIERTLAGLAPPGLH